MIMASEANRFSPPLSSIFFDRTYGRLEQAQHQLLVIPQGATPRGSMQAHHEPRAGPAPSTARPRHVGAVHGGARGGLPFHRGRMTHRMAHPSAKPLTSKRTADRAESGLRDRAAHVRLLVPYRGDSGDTSDPRAQAPARVCRQYRRKGAVPARGIPVRARSLARANVRQVLSDSARIYHGADDRPDRQRRRGG